MLDVWRKRVAPTLIYINAAGEGTSRVRIHRFVEAVAEAVISRELEQARSAIRALNEAILQAIQETQN
jgi:hypothetical protein